VKRKDPTPAALVESALVEVGLRPGDRVRFRQREGGSWKEATVERRERDGSVGVRDERGAARALTLDRLQVRTTGRRGGSVWVPVVEKAGQDEQLGLL
jgi:hypothetical protein